MASLRPRAIFSMFLVSAALVVSPGAAAQSEMQDRLERPIHSLLLEKESPILGIHWSGQLFVDAPVGNEPPDAALTLRRAKLKFHRALGPNWQIKLAGDYTKGGKLELSDNYAVYTGWKAALIKLGVTDPPFSLEAASSSASLTFMETALPVAALSEPKSGGVNLVRRTPKSIVNASLLVLNPRQDGLSSSGQALVLRYIHAPISLVGQENVHVGASFSYRTNAKGEDTRFRSRPEIATANTYFVDTGEIDDASDIVRIGLESSHIEGRFSWQTELISSRVKRGDGDSLHFWGAYSYVSWFLTPDTRNYDQGQGQFVPVSVSQPFRSGGWGAWELAVRASYVDLEDRNVAGGRESNLSFGLNWYLNDDIRLMANVVKVLDVDRPASEFDGADPLIGAVRLQWLIR